MRKAFFDCLFEQAHHDHNLYLMIGDVGFSVVESFQQTFPQRFINAGIAEQNMIGVAAGLAMAGKNVYVYSIVPFVTMRGFEQIRNNLCYQKLQVKLIGVGGGFSYGALGVTHHAIEDIAIMRALPEMSVVAPANKYEASALFGDINEKLGPVYIRLSNNEELVTYPKNTTPKFGKTIVITPHHERYIIATGNALDLAYQTQQHLATIGIDIGLASMPTIKPLDYEFLANQSLQALFTIEEHSIVGGLGESIASTLFRLGRNTITFHSFGVNDVYAHGAGTRSFLKEQAGLSKEKIAEVIVEKLKGVHGSRHSADGLVPHHERDIRFF